MLVMGVDPGLTGGVAFYAADRSGVINAVDMPTVAKRVDGSGIARLVREFQPSVAFVEQVSSRPGQGVASTFTFGCGYGVVLGVLAACEVPLHLVVPGKWKKHFRLGSDKSASRQRAVDLWPAHAGLFARVRDDGRAEAALLALYGASVLNREVGR